MINYRKVVSEKHNLIGMFNWLYDLDLTVWTMPCHIIYVREVYEKSNDIETFGIWQETDFVEENIYSWSYMENTVYS